MNTMVPAQSPSLPRPQLIFRVIFAVLFLLAIVAALYLVGLDLQENTTYNKAAISWLKRYADVLDQFDTFAQHPKSSDPAWQDAMHQQLREIKMISAGIRTYHPALPNPFNNRQDGLITYVANPYDEFADLYASGLDTNNPALITQAQKIRASADFQRTKYADVLDLDR